MTLSRAIERIKITPSNEASQVALFRLPGSLDRVEVVFAKTAYTEQRIAGNDPLFIGIFDQTVPYNELLSVLKGIAL